jgi:cell division septal protein FtsQ
MKWFNRVKTAPEPTWKISTKVVSHPETVLLRTRKKQSSFLEYFKVASDFFIRYFRTVGWVVLSGLLVTFLVVVFTTPLFSLKAERIELVLDPEPVFDRAAVMTLMRDFAGKNIFRLSTTEIFTSLQSNVRHIQSVEKTLLLPDGIRVKVTSFGPIYRAFISDEIFLLTRNGQLIVDIPEIETSALRIHTLTSDPNGMQNTTLSTGDTFIIQEIEKLWYKELPDFPIEALDYFDQEKELHITSKGTRFIFTLSG